MKGRQPKTRIHQAVKSTFVDKVHNSYRKEGNYTLWFFTGNSIPPFDSSHFTVP